MLTFRSEVFPDFFSKKLGYQDKTIFVGSCFTENIGKKMLDLKFHVLINPFGILYNPVSVAQCLKLCMNPVVFSADDLIYLNEKWISFLHHGRFSGTNRDEVLKIMNDELQRGKIFIKESLVLFVTFGTSWVYKYKLTNQVVSNCHKIPANEFEHYSLNVSEIVEMYTQILKELKSLNSDIKVIFTVSPVRHWKDGAVNNQLSKSILILAIHELLKKFDFVSYFPSYEIMMDDLRDYRFYAEDLFHPNQVGIDYIWSKFKASFILEKSFEIADKIEKLNKAVLHNAFYPNTLAYSKFIDSNLKLIEQLKKLVPGINFDVEMQHFSSEKRKFHA